MKPENDVSVNGRKTSRDDGGETIRTDGRREGVLSVVAAVAVVSGVVSVVGSRMGTYALDVLDSLSTGSGTATPSALLGESAFHFVAASIAVRIVRGLSIVAGGIAIVLGCWVVFAGAVRVVGRW